MDDYTTPIEPIADSTGLASEWDGQERRAALRVALLIRSGKLIVDGREFLCVIRDVSANGVNVRLFHPIANDKSLVLELANGGRYPVELVWNSDDKAGLRFIDEIDLQSIIDEPLGTFQKRQMRLRITLGGKIHSRGEACEMTLLDISQQGACIDCEKHLHLNELIRIESDALSPIHAKVRWRRESRYGLVFEQVFSFDELARLLAHLQIRDTSQLTTVAEPSALRALG